MSHLIHFVPIDRLESYTLVIKGYLIKLQRLQKNRVKKKQALNSSLSFEVGSTWCQTTRRFLLWAGLMLKNQQTLLIFLSKARAKKKLNVFIWEL